MKIGYNGYTCIDVCFVLLIIYIPIEILISPWRLYIINAYFYVSVMVCGLFGTDPVYKSNLIFCIGPLMFPNSNSADHNKKSTAEDKTPLAWLLLSPNIVFHIVSRSPILHYKHKIDRLLKNKQKKMQSKKIFSKKLANLRALSHSLGSSISVSSYVFFFLQTKIRTLE